MMMWRMPPSLSYPQEPATDFCLCDGEQVEEVYAYCNLHGLWKC